MSIVRFNLRHARSLLKAQLKLLFFCQNTLFLIWLKIFLNLANCFKLFSTNLVMDYNEKFKLSDAKDSDL